jgi:hypothetical protein
MSPEASLQSLETGFSELEALERAPRRPPKKSAPKKRAGPPRDELGRFMGAKKK